jgi:hypothetical protein
MTAPITHAHTRQYLAPRFLGKIEVDNGEIGTLGRVVLYSLDELYRLFAVRDDDEFPFNAVLFKGTAD